MTDIRTSSQGECASSNAELEGKYPVPSNKMAAYVYDLKDLSALAAL